MRIIFCRVNIKNRWTVGCIRLTLLWECIYLLKVTLIILFRIKAILILILLLLILLRLAVKLIHRHMLGIIILSMNRIKLLTLNRIVALPLVLLLFLLLYYIISRLTLWYVLHLLIYLPFWNINHFLRLLFFLFLLFLFLLECFVLNTINIKDHFHVLPCRFLRSNLHQLRIAWLIRRCRISLYCLLDSFLPCNNLHHHYTSVSFNYSIFFR